MAFPIHVSMGSENGSQKKNGWFISLSYSLSYSLWSYVQVKKGYLLRPHSQIFVSTESLRGSLTSLSDHCRSPLLVWCPCWPLPGSDLTIGITMALWPYPSHSQKCQNLPEYDPRNLKIAGSWTWITMNNPPSHMILIGFKTPQIIILNPSIFINREAFNSQLAMWSQQRFGPDLVGTNLDINLSRSRKITWIDDVNFGEFFIYQSSHED